MNVGYRLGANITDLASVLTAIPDWRYMILQKPADIQCTTYDPATSWADWEQGVVFGPTAHLQWRRRRGGAFHLMLLSSQELPAGFTSVGQTDSCKTASVYLWGERQFTSKGQPTAEWVEGRIPQVITGLRGYPLDTSPVQKTCRVKLEMEVLELPRPNGDNPEQFDPSPAKWLERYLSLKEVCGEEV
ncbi:hypothetical protein [Desulfobacca acetoxidans]|uniref:Uncharacterized protein n=1 Tax=Desulfobacca acetoxidans (strain ATCC 700848 / DSM 11109 / ASRB2) TaxID=880072 RepID=F2NE32_DESAR|nr:hypothetical protein [Desulfobacca acetoxidans]AEB10600.1 hypothetical protein Desac_2793 [Desulfobacca acetoxidans DSM 11109]